MIYREETELCRISESTTEVDRTANIEGGVRGQSMPREKILDRFIVIRPLELDSVPGSLYMTKGLSI